MGPSFPPSALSLVCTPCYHFFHPAFSPLLLSRSPPLSKASVSSGGTVYILHNIYHNAAWEHSTWIIDPCEIIRKLYAIAPYVCAHALFMCVKFDLSSLFESLEPRFSQAFPPPPLFCSSMPHFCGLTLICTDSYDACSLSAIHFIQSMLRVAMLTSVSFSLSPTSLFFLYFHLLYQISATPPFFFFYLYLHLLLFLLSSSSISPGITLPLLHHAFLWLPQPLPASRPSRGLLLRPLGRPGAREASPTPASAPASIAPPPHQRLTLPLPPSPAALPSPPAPGLPLTEREGRGRRWRPLRPYPSAASPPHGPTQHPAWPQHRRSPGGELQRDGAGRGSGERGLPSHGTQRGGADNEWDGP